MSDLPGIGGVAGTFVGPNGKEYRYAPLTLRDEAELELEIRAALGDKLDVMAQVRSVLHMYQAPERAVLLEAAFKEELRLKRLGAIDLAAEFKVADVEAMVLRKQLKSHHPDITLDEVRGLSSDWAIRKLMSMLSEQFRAAMGNSAWLRLMEGMTRAEPNGTDRTETAGDLSSGA